MELTVVTYGGGEILKNIFEAIAILMNNNTGELYKPLCLIAASIGTLWAATKAFFSQSAESYLSQYLLPLVGITGLLMVPTTEVHIEDVLKDRSYTVSHVPMILARFSELVSAAGYRITSSFEKVMHLPNDTSYNQTGMIFGAESSLEMSQFKITDANLDQNLRRFCKQCVLYDIALGRYSIDELKKSADLWKLFQEKTSKVRMIKYCPPGDPDISKCSYCSCKDALAKMAPFFEKEKRFYGNHEVLKHLPLTFQAMTGIQKESEELIGQQLVMNTLYSEFNSHGFAKYRAQAQQQSTFLTVGSMASSSLITMRCVIEALLYVSFIFVMPMSLLPSGYRFIGKWLWMLVWIQMWPPLYAVLGYVMQTVAHHQAASVLAGLGHSEIGLSFFTSSGLKHINESIFATAGYISMSIPMISYALVQGGLHSMMHLSGAMTSSVQGAASSAAAEQASGNYSLANASLGQMSYKNSTAMQKNFAPSLSAGFMQENTGVMAATYGGGETIINQASSNLRVGFSGSGIFNQAIQGAEQQAISTLESSQKGYTESISVTARNGVDFVEHLAHSSNYSDSTSNKEGHDISESARYLQTTAEDISNQHGISKGRAMELVIAGGIDTNKTILGKVTQLVTGVSASAKLSNAEQARRDELMSHLTRVTESEDFQENFQKIKGALHSKTINESDDEGKRLSSNFTKSLDESYSQQNSYSMALSKSKQISEIASWSRNNSIQVQQSLNQEFVDWASQKYQPQGGYSKLMEVMSSPESNVERRSLIDGFVGHVESSMLKSFALNPDGLNGEGLQKDYMQYNNERINKEKETADLTSHKDSLIQQEGLNQNIKDTVGKEMKDEISRNRRKVDDSMKNSIISVSKQAREMGNQYKDSYDKGLLRQIFSSKKAEFSNKDKFYLTSKNDFQKDKPFWME